MDLGSSLNSDFSSKFIKSMAYVKKSGSICTKPTAPSSTAFDWRKIFKMHLGQIVRCPVKKVEKFFSEIEFQTFVWEKISKNPHRDAQKEFISLSLSLSLPFIHYFLKKSANPGLFFIYFWSFKKNQYNF